MSARTGAAARYGNGGFARSIRRPASRVGDVHMSDCGRNGCDCHDKLNVFCAIDRSGSRGERKIASHSAGSVCVSNMMRRNLPIIVIVFQLSFL